jgi:hypothetical protein
MYKLTKSAIEGKDPSCILTEDGLTAIPINPDNTDYQAYLKWLAEGNTPLPAENA